MPNLLTCKELEALTEEELKAHKETLLRDMESVFASYPAHIQVKILRAQGDAVEQTEPGTSRAFAMLDAWSAVTAEWREQGCPQEDTTTP